MLRSDRDTADLLQPERKNASSFDALDLSNQSTYTMTTPGAAFQFTQSYQGPGMTNQTLIQRVTEIQSVTDTTSVFTQ